MGEGDEDEEEEDTVPSAPVTAATANGPSRQPVAPPVDDAGDDGFWDEEPEIRNDKPAAGSAAARNQAASKKKPKGKKSGGKNTTGDIDDNIPDPPPKQSQANQGKRASAAWMAQAVERTFQGSVLLGLLSPSAWSLCDGDTAEERLAELAEGLSWSKPLGLAMSLGWSGFFGLEIDFGPKSTSRRDETPFLTRMQKNIPVLLEFYLTAVFFFLLLHALANFELFFLVVAFQFALVVALPAVAERLAPPAQILVLQGAHLLLWLFFVRSLWTTHLFIKMFAVAVVCAHAYVVVPLGDS